MTAGVPRPRDWAMLWLAGLGGPPRQRPRDQRADVVGIGLLRELLDYVVAVDPDPDALEAALAEAVSALGGPDGPARALAALIRDQWWADAASPASAAWLLAEAIEHADPSPPRRRRPACEPPAAEGAKASVQEPPPRPLANHRPAADDDRAIAPSQASDQPARPANPRSRAHGT
ncbi:MAG: hypothetical protein KatS3mg108_2416 [Isosphaeraceae bacterium]|nr:MAG: hypothetical protein KatS3mg108_2416 [Isosphaeraceae bacterium]